MKRIVSIITLLAMAGSLAAQQVNEFISRGNDYYRKEEYQKAYNEYQKALNLDPGNTVARFNQANSMYRQQQKVEAAKMFSSLVTTVSERPLRSIIYYNKGVILTDQKNLEESIEAYKNALRNDPSNKEARENLQKALLELKKKPQPDKKDNKENKKQQQNQQQQKMNQKESQQRLQLLQQKEKQVQERIQNEKNRGDGGSNNKDW